MSTQGSPGSIDAATRVLSLYVTTARKVVIADAAKVCTLLASVLDLLRGMMSVV